MADEVCWGRVVVGDRKFQIQLAGLIQLLAQNLYAEPDVFLREMIQNAHDSIMRRAELAAERGETELPAPEIRVLVSPEERTVTVQDNGSGLTRVEIDDYLSTIGRSGTGELRRRIEEADRARTVELIGQFGIGLLSAFIVAERVEVVTRGAGQDALLWESAGGETYRVSPASRERVGTTVTLHLRSGNSRYLDPARLHAIIRTYADFLGMPVYLGAEAEPANAVHAPWHRSYPSDAERAVAGAEFWAGRFLNESALHVFAVDEPVWWDDATAPDGRRRGRVRGVLAITDRHVPGVNARGTVDLYIKRMFIGAANRDVLPPWARFIQGVVECDELTPNAARDNVMRNAALAAVRETLGAVIEQELTGLSRRDHRNFIEIMRWHAYHILAMAVQPEHERFFRTVADLMPLESDQGPITMADYLATAQLRADGTRVVHYIIERNSANQYFLLASARGIRVLNCAEAFAERFLERYARIWPARVHLSRLDAAAETIFEPLLGEEAERFGGLLAAYSLLYPDLPFVARISRFRPAEMPAVLTETRDGKSQRELREVAAHPGIPHFIRDLIATVATESQAPRTLHLNADNPIIRRLAGRPDLSDEVSRHALVSLYTNASMLLARTLQPHDIQPLVEQYNRLIDLMLSLAAERAALEDALTAALTGRGQASASTADNAAGLNTAGG